jgi:hypothetical protein
MAYEPRPGFGQADVSELLLSMRLPLWHSRIGCAGQVLRLSAVETRG